jgi:hypothetical protein
MPMRSHGPGLAALVFLALFAGASATALAGKLVGDASDVFTGSTLRIGGDRIRLWGLYTPKPDTPRGADASIFVRRITLGQTLTCEEKARSGDQVLARCWLGDRDLVTAIIAAGLGRECPRDSNGLYSAYEAPFVLMRMPLPESCER